MYSEDLKNNIGSLVQSAIDWENVVHRRENTPENEQHLNENRFHFTGQALTVLTWLQKGLKVCSDFANKNNITDLQRRIGDLGEGGIDIDRDYILKRGGKKSRMLVYFFPGNRNKFIKRGVIDNRPRWWYSKLYTPPEIINKIEQENGKRSVK